VKTQCVSAGPPVRPPALRGTVLCKGPDGKHTLCPLGWEAGLQKEVMHPLRVGRISRGHNHQVRLIVRFSHDAFEVRFKTMHVS